MQKLDEVVKILKHEIGQDFFGTITIKVRNGEAVHLAVERSIKLDDDSQEKLGNSKLRDKTRRI